MIKSELTRVLNTIDPQTWSETTKPIDSVTTNGENVFHFLGHEAFESSHLYKDMIKYLFENFSALALQYNKCGDNLCGT